MADTLAQTLAGNTREGELYEKLDDGRIRCYACGHRCPIPEGKAGVCKIRFNQGGKLYVPAGYVAGIQDDPIEKKPFFHALPGARALSFGMLGCDYHCSYCFPPGTRIATSRGPLPIEQIVEDKMSVAVYTHAGRRRRILHYFRRNYKGRLLKIKPAFLPAIECTAEHQILSRLRPDRFPEDVPTYRAATELTKNHCLTIPKAYEFSERIVLEPGDSLESAAKQYRAGRKIDVEQLRKVVRLSDLGRSSREIGKLIGKSASHIRHLKSKVKRGVWNLKNLGIYQAKIVEEAGRIRLSKEHAPGIPAKIELSEKLAELFGYYCAEGCVTESKGRVHSATITFAFSRKEQDKAERVQLLLSEIFGVQASLIKRTTTLGVCSGKTSLALFFRALCGGRGSRKRVPEAIFRCKRDVVRSFLNAYVAGDGHITAGGHVRISTISRELAWGVAWLVQKLGYLPQCYEYDSVQERMLLGRSVRQSPKIYLVRWYDSPKKQRHVWEDKDYRYVLIHKIEEEAYEGPVYNLEVEEDHTYLANGVAVHNCQNWVTSQALRDPVAGSSIVKVTPQKIVEIARERDCQVVTSTYNEPLITSEWAVEIFREAKKAGLVTSYVSNGNGTPEVLDYIQPWVDLYKVDLKSFNDRHYRELGGELDNVMRTIRDLYARGIWLEVLTLLIPGFNDSPDELKQLTEFVASISPEIPWHVTAFHKDYKMTAPENTRPEHLLRAVDVAKRSGLKYIYPGNLPGQVGDGENTFCPDCGELLIERFGFEVREDRVTPAGGCCPKCRTKIPGFWREKSSKRPSEGHVSPLL
ncbi:MAG: radical SAM protein [Candidatus Omnitrophota bacterium]|nr:radical SAM protein [Candidatus Omnitrophota bacterium]